MRGWVAGLIWIVGGGLAAAALALLAIAMISGPVGDGTRQSAEAKGPKRVCPPPVALAPRPAGAPVDDVFGVRLGYSVPEAQETLLCADEAYTFRFDASWHSPRDAAAPRQLMYAYGSGEREVIVGLVGLDGSERVGALWRREPFLGAAGPALQALESELVAVYGPAHAVERGRNRLILIWSYAPNGQPMPATDRSFFGSVQQAVAPKVTRETCAARLQDLAITAPNPDAACGLTIRATVERRLEAPEQASSLRLVVLDQAKLAADIAALRARGATPL